LRQSGATGFEPLFGDCTFGRERVDRAGALAQSMQVRVEALRAIQRAEQHAGLAHERMSMLEHDRNMYQIGPQNTGYGEQLAERNIWTVTF
jgi:hypothetical protein